MKQMMHLLDKTVAENSWLKETVVSITNNPSSPYADALKHGGGIKEHTRPVQSDKGTLSKPMGTTTNRQQK